jgi:hypothetical protein
VPENITDSYVISKSLFIKHTALLQKICLVALVFLNLLYSYFQVIVLMSNKFYVKLHFLAIKDKQVTRETSGMISIFKVTDLKT